MPSERKTARISARIPASLVARVDYAVNNDVSAQPVRNRSSAIQAALEDWLPGYEFDTGKILGTPPKKAR